MGATVDATSGTLGQGHAARSADLLGKDDAGTLVWTINAAAGVLWTADRRRQGPRCGKTVRGCSDALCSPGHVETFTVSLSAPTDRGVISCATAVATVVDSAVNVAPSTALTGPSTLDEDVATVVGVSLSDPDARPGDAIFVRLTSTGSTITRPGNDQTNTGNGRDGCDDDRVHAALAQLETTGNANLNGASGVASLTVHVDDQMSYGYGGAQTDTDTYDLALTAVNDPPVLTAVSGTTFSSTACVTARHWPTPTGRASPSR